MAHEGNEIVSRYDDVSVKLYSPSLRVLNNQSPSPRTEREKRRVVSACVAFVRASYYSSSRTETRGEISSRFTMENLSSPPRLPPRGFSLAEQPTPRNLLKLETLGLHSVNSEHGISISVLSSRAIVVLDLAAADRR